MNKLELYPHQKVAVNKLRNGSILWGGVGTILRKEEVNERRMGRH